MVHDERNGRREAKGRVFPSRSMPRRAKRTSTARMAPTQFRCGLAIPAPRRRRCCIGYYHQPGQRRDASATKTSRPRRYRGEFPVRCRSHRPVRRRHIATLARGSAAPKDFGDAIAGPLNEQIEHLQLGWGEVDERGGDGPRKLFRTDARAVPSKVERQKVREPPDEVPDSLLSSPAAIQSV